LLLLVGAIGVFAFSRPLKKATIVAEGVKTVQVNEKVTIPIFIDTAGATINAAEMYLTFNPNELRVDSISKEPSFFVLWIKDQPAFSNETGTISFAGGLPTPGFSGKGQVGSVTIIAKKHGTIKLTFDPKTRILLNDGIGTVVPLRLLPITLRAK
jgi:hypothetical protein